MAAQVEPQDGLGAVAAATPIQTQTQHLDTAWAAFEQAVTDAVVQLESQVQTDVFADVEIEELQELRGNFEKLVGLAKQVDAEVYEEKLAYLVEKLNSATKAVQQNDIVAAEYEHAYAQFKVEDPLNIALEEEIASIETAMTDPNDWRYGLDSVDIQRVEQAFDTKEAIELLMLYQRTRKQIEDYKLEVSAGLAR